MLFAATVLPVQTHISYSTLITDSQGKVVHAYLSRDDKWRMKTELNEISPKLKKAIIAKEDRWFYYHIGVNPLSVIRAIASNIKKGKRVSGASTITMQVARMLNRQNRTWGAKLNETFRALQLEMKYSKDEILQLYLNLLPYGGNIEGIKSASVLYLSKNPVQLSIAEIATLAVIPNQPNALKPGANHHYLLQQRNKWVTHWGKQRLFTVKETSDALTEPMAISRKAAPANIPHLAHLLKRQYPGKTIATYINMNLQSKAENIVKDYVVSLKSIDVHNAAVVVVDNQSKKVICYLGSADFYNTTDAGQVNGARAIRQPGSALKPLLYAQGIDEGLFCPQTVINDVPINFNGYQPENYDNNFNGPVTIARALENSLNIPAVSALQQLGKDKFITKLSSCGFKQIYKDRKKLGLSMILGGCGVTLEEMTALYSCLANKGVYKPLKYCNLQATAPSTRLLSEAATFMITDMLVKITRPDLPVGYENSTHLPRIAWKTGTSYGRRDAWSIGYNKHYTIGVWVGNFSNRGVPELSGAAIATPLLFQLFNSLDYNSQAAWYSMPAGCDMRRVCSVSGLLPQPFCDKTRMDYFIPMVSPAKACTHLKEIAVSPDEKMSYCTTCLPAEGYKKKWYQQTDAALLAWYRSEETAFETVPSHNPDCERIFSENAPEIIFPVNGQEYLISTSNPEPLQLSCTVSADVKLVYWYVNHTFAGMAAAGEKLFFEPPPGKVKISCTDDKGRTHNIAVKVKMVDW